jgi:hypothetical protein
MERRRNFFPLAGFLVCVVAFLSYFLFFYRFPATRDVPWVNWLLFAIGLVLVAAGAARPFREPERYRGRILSPVLAVSSVAVVAFFLFGTLVASRDLPAAAGAPGVGQKAPDFVLQDARGRSVRLYDLLGRESWVVLVFYRGYW